MIVLGYNVRFREIRRRRIRMRTVDFNPYLERGDIS